MTSPRTRLLLAGVLLVAGVAAVILVSAPDAEATHFRAGTMQWHHLRGQLPELPVSPSSLGVPDYNNLQPTVNMTMRVAFRCTFFGGCPFTVGTSVCTGCVGSVNWGDASSSVDYDLIVEQYDASLDMIYVRFVQQGTVSDMVHQYPFDAAAQYTADWGSCCRLSYSGPLNQAHINNPDQSWHLETIIDLTRSNYSPTAVLIPIRICPQSGWCHFQTYFNDPDNDTVTFRLATSNEATGGSPFAQPAPCPPISGSPGCGTPGAASIDNNGTVHWFVTGATIRNAPWMTYYSMQIMIEDQSTKTPLDYFIRLDPPQPPPVCDPAGQTVVVGRPAYWNSTGDGNTWAAPGGSPPSGSGSAGSTTYDRPGTYYVTVTNSGGSVDCVIDVVWPPPVCAPTPQTVLIQQAASFTASSGPVSNYSWSAPYGNPGSQVVAPAPAGAAFSTKYDSPGTYTVTVDSDGLTGDCVVVVPGPACSPLTQQVPLGTGVTLSATGGDGTYAWRMPLGGSPAAGTGPTFSPTFAFDGHYPVDLTSHGITARCYVDVITPPPAPSFAWAQSQAGCGSHPVAFADLSNSIAPIASWRWEFGDGATSAEQSPTHTYTNSGTYTVSLTVVDVNSHATTISRALFLLGNVDCNSGLQAPDEANRNVNGPRDGRDPTFGDVDTDRDGVDDVADLCPTTFDAQSDLDHDGLGDACDADMDGDAVKNLADNCMVTANKDQSDLEFDGAGDACDTDLDGDGVDNDVDVCPLQADSQADADKDGVGDACEEKSNALGALRLPGASRGDADAGVGVEAPATANAGMAGSTILVVALAGAGLAVVVGIAIWRRK